MNLDEYQREAMRTSGTHFDHVDLERRNRALVLAALGLSGEAGEFTDEIKKVAFHAKPLDVEHAIKELGDILWYLALAAETLDVTLDAVAEANVRKLRARYPTGFVGFKEREGRP